MSAAYDMDSTADHDAGSDFVTAMVADERVGIPIALVRDVFETDRITPVPLAPAGVAGILSLRGRIVTAIDLRARLGLTPRAASQAFVVIGVDVGGESYGLIVDEVAEVMRLAAHRREDVPTNFDRDVAAIAECIYRLDEGLLVVIDVKRGLDLAPDARAA